MRARRQQGERCLLRAKFQLYLGVASGCLSAAPRDTLRDAWLPTGAASAAWSCASGLAAVSLQHSCRFPIRSIIPQRARGNISHPSVRELHDRSFKRKDDLAEGFGRSLDSRDNVRAKDSPHDLGTPRERILALNRQYNGSGGMPTKLESIMAASPKRRVARQ